MISRAPGLKLVVETLITSLKPIGNIVLICCAFFIIFGILGVQVQSLRPSLSLRLSSSSFLLFYSLFSCFTFTFMPLSLHKFHFDLIWMYLYSVFFTSLFLVICPFFPLTLLCFFFFMPDFDKVVRNEKNNLCNSDLLNLVFLFHLDSFSKENSSTAWVWMSETSPTSLTACLPITSGFITSTTSTIWDRWAPFTRSLFQLTLFFMSHSLPKTSSIISFLFFPFLPVKVTLQSNNIIIYKLIMNFKKDISW